MRIRIQAAIESGSETLRGAVCVCEAGAAKISPGSATLTLTILDHHLRYCRLLGNLVLNLWDCGGQESFMENYYRSQKENIFRNVEVNVDFREF
jgi:hypothetical protein